jgi:hypothetical protein
VLAYPNFELSFILTTDASKVAVAALIPSPRWGRNPIACASRQLNKAEQSYAASEIEKLALVWATKYFRCYLYGKKFLVRTDHSALTYLRNFPENNSRLLRWSLKLSELDFTVEHRAGSKIPHVDALSRHVGTVMQEDILDWNNILREQAKDAFCVKQKPGIYSSSREFFLDDEGVMYRRQTGNKYQLVVPKTLINH